MGLTVLLPLQPAGCLVYSRASVSPYWEVSYSSRCFLWLRCFNLWRQQMSPHLVEGPSPTPLALARPTPLKTTNWQETINTPMFTKTIIYLRLLILKYCRIITHWCFIDVQILPQKEKKMWKSKSLEQRASELLWKLHTLGSLWNCCHTDHGLKTKAIIFPTTIQFLKPWSRSKTKKNIVWLQTQLLTSYMYSFVSSYVFQGHDKILPYWEKKWGGGEFQPIKICTISSTQVDTPSARDD